MSFQSHFENHSAVKIPGHKTTRLSHGSDVAVHTQHGFLIWFLPTPLWIRFQHTSPPILIADAFCERNQKFKLNGRR